MKPSPGYERVSRGAGGKRRAFLTRVLGALSGTFLAAVLAAAAPQPCNDPMLLVDTPDPLTFDRICADSIAAMRAVTICGISQDAAILVKPVDHVELPIGPGLAAFDCRVNSISILWPDIMQSRIGPDDPYSRLSKEALFRSVLTHEMAHALLHQTGKGCPIPLVDHEYVANALELAALTPEDRTALVEASNIDWSPSADVISAGIYFIAPRKFAVAAWRYHDLQGCDPIRGIVAGTYSFEKER
ncbi:DUF6639 family protein [Tropicimonas marinistellae]|uniref:DUF6639 family protein n=1 Tax=Tropicimonas marinistellae TaxID=1739787 RepID=UPI00082E0960|nr:DUF6639 family protein [Tropicimonas marinistellae]